MTTTTTLYWWDPHTVVWRRRDHELSASTNDTSFVPSAVSGVRALA